MLLVNTEHAGEAVIVRCVGRIVAGEEVASLKKAVLCHQEGKVIVLDLSRVESIDGAGLGLFAFLAGWTRLTGTKLIVTDPRPHVLELLDLTRLSSVLEIRFSEDLSAAAVRAALYHQPAALPCHH